MESDKPKSNLTKKIFISILLFLITIFLLIIIIIIPTVKKIKGLGDNIEKQRIDLENRYVKSQSLKQSSENLKKITSKLDRLDRIFINNNRELEFITTLEAISQNNNILQKINLNPGQAEPGQKYKKIPIQLIAQGNFMRLIAYLVNLESLDYYINIKSLDLSPNSGQSLTDKIQPDLNSLNLYLSADTFWE